MFDFALAHIARCALWERQDLIRTSCHLSPSPRHVLLGRLVPAKLPPSPFLSVFSSFKRTRGRLQVLTACLTVGKVETVGANANGKGRAPEQS